MKRKSRVLLAVPALVILAGFVVYQYGYLRLEGQMRTLRESEAVKIGTLKRSVDLVSTRADLEKRLSSLKESRKAYDSRLIEGPTPSVAAASLLNMIKGLTTARGGTISSERVDKPEDLDNFKVVGVSIDASVPDIRFLNEILFAMETQTPSLVVREIEVRVKNMREPKELAVRLRISGIASGK